MVQTLNLPGVRAFFSCLVSSQLARPQISVQNITEISFGSLKSKQSDCIVFDKDNCLTRPYASDIYPPFQKAFQDCIRVFGKENVAVYSNSAGTPDDPGHIQARALEKSLGVPVLRHNEKKPDGGAEIARHFGVSPQRIAFVGDRLLTDVVFANRNGFLSIHTRQAITEEGDNRAALWIRRIENWWLYKTPILTPRKKA